MEIIKQKLLLSLLIKSENSIRYNPIKVIQKELLDIILGNEAKGTICEDSIIIDKLDYYQQIF